MKQVGAVRLEIEAFAGGIRGEKDYDTYLQYMISNPLRRGLVERPEDYPWCKVRRERP